MRLSHSISVTLFVSALASLSGCSDEAASDDGGSPTGGTAGASGAATGGAAGAGTGGAATGGAPMGGAGSGTGGAATGGGGGGAIDYPTDTTQEGIVAFLAAESYKSAPWRAEAMPGNDAALPHLATNRFFNGTIIASKAAGNRTPTTQHTAGSMSVKEILDGTTVVGKAAMLRTSAMQWIYYCTATVGSRCGMGVADGATYYGTGANPACACHGSGTNNSHDAIPTP
jgi:hypothetical protein